MVIATIVLVHGEPSSPKTDPLQHLLLHETARGVERLDRTSSELRYTAAVTYVCWRRSHGGSSHGRMNKGEAVQVTTRTGPHEADPSTNIVPLRQSSRLRCLFLPVEDRRPLSLTTTDR